MPSVNYISFTTVIGSVWMNEANNILYNLLGSGSGLAPTSRAQIVTNLGIAGGGTVTHSLGVLTQYQLVLGNSGADLYTMGSLGTSGQILYSQGAGNPPIWSTAPVTAISIASANGFAGSSGGGTTPALTISTSVTGLLKGNGTSVTAAINSDLPAMTATVGGAVPTPPNNTTTYLRGDGTFATPAGSGTVTNTAGNLLSGHISVGNAGSDLKTTTVILNAPATSGALTFGTDNSTLTFQGTGTVVNRDSTDTFTNKTFDTAGAGNLFYINGTAITATTGSGSVVLNSVAVTFPSLSAAQTLGYLGIPQVIKSADYTTLIGDAGCEIYHPVGDANARTFTIDSNAHVPYPIGTVIVFTNMSANSCTIAITSDAMYWLPTGGTGSRTIAQYGKATAQKETSTTWTITGVGLT